MRKKKTVRIELTTNGANQIETFVKLGLSKYNAADILRILLEQISNSDTMECSEVILKDYGIQDTIKEQVRWEDKLEGYLSVKVDTAVNKDRIEDFILTHIYPYYNQQQTLFA